MSKKPPKRKSSKRHPASVWECVRISLVACAVVAIFVLGLLYPERAKGEWGGEITAGPAVRMGMSVLTGAIAVAFCYAAYRSTATFLWMRRRAQHQSRGYDIRLRSGEGPCSLGPIVGAGRGRVVLCVVSAEPFMEQEYEIHVHVCSGDGRAVRTDRLVLSPNLPEGEDNTSAFGVKTDWWPVFLRLELDPVPNGLGEFAAWCDVWSESAPPGLPAEFDREQK